MNYIELPKPWKKKVTPLAQWQYETFITTGSCLVIFLVSCMLVESVLRG